MKPIVQINKAGIIIEIYKSAEEAGKLNKLRANHITECARGIQYRQRVGGYKWEYAEND